MYQLKYDTLTGYAARVKTIIGVNDQDVICTTGINEFAIQGFSVHTFL